LAGVVGGNAISPNFGGEAELLSSRFDLSLFDTIQNVPLGQTLANNPQVLLLLKLTKKAGAVDQRIMEIQQYFSAQFRRTSGIGFPFCEWQSSTDGISFNLLGQISDASPTFTEDSQEVASILLQTDVFFLRVVVANSNVLTVGDIQYLKFFVDLVFPQGYILEQLV